ncbi:hypothetical protein O1L44_30025 [Streptomyces noursei]|nr:hypothetical protein [Streptomyces noursei]
MRTRRELEAFEAAVFQFGQRTRAFLDAFPTDLPEPVAVLPKFANGYGATSYLHLTCAARTTSRRGRTGSACL